MDQYCISAISWEGVGTFKWEPKECETKIKLSDKDAEKNRV